MTRVRAVRGFGWAGRVVDPGEELDVSPRDAHLLVNGYGDCIYLGEAPPPPGAMVVNADPVISHGDPVVETKVQPKRRGTKP